MLPFEDFDLASASRRRRRHAADQPRLHRRSRRPTTCIVGWADPGAAKPATTIRVLRRALSLPPATAADLTISSVIIADDVQARPAPYPPAEQAAHPYAIGATEITPARDTVFTRDERLSVAFQVINAQSTDTGKPDVAVDFRIVRVDGEREVPVASLNPQTYTEAHDAGGLRPAAGPPVVRRRRRAAWRRCHAATIG